MLDTKTEQVGRIVDGTFFMKLHGDNVFAQKSAEVIRIEKMCDEARARHTADMVTHILHVFREEVEAFTTQYEKAPTRCLMNYRDISNLIEAYNQERAEKELPRERISYYDSDDKKVIDGITIKSGCDQEPGQFRFYSFE